MNSTLEDNRMETTTPFVRSPERFLLVGSDEDWCVEARATLARLAAELPAPSFLSWRLRHGLLRVLPVNRLDEALTQALSVPTAKDVRRNVTRVWTTQSEAQWYAFASDCAVLIASAARGVTLSLLGMNESLSGVAKAANRPDALARLSWLMEGRPQPVPRDWLSLGTLPELDVAQNATMAEEGYRCYAAWAESVLASYEPEELQELWGPLPEEHEVEEETESEKPAENVLPFRRPLTPQPPPSQTSRRFRADDAMALAAASAGDGAASGASPAQDWALDPAVSHGAYRLQAWVRSYKSREEKPGIEYVALWNDGRKTPLQPDDIRLVLTLSRAKPVVLAGRPDKEPARGSLYSMRFEWPQDSWPEGVIDAPSPHLKRKLKEALEKARVSLM